MPALCGTITALLDVNRKPLTKGYSVRRDGSVIKSTYPQTAEVQTYRLPFVGFAGMVETLDKIAAASNAAIIRGVLGKWHLGDVRPVYRLAKPQPALVYAGSGKRVPSSTVRQQQ